MKNLIFIYVIALCALLLPACNPTASQPAADMAGDTITHHAQLLTMVKKNGVVVAEITDPWNRPAILQRLVLVPEGYEGDPGIEGTRITCPVKKSMVSSVMFAQAIDELGATGAIAAVSDAEYFKNPNVRKAIDSGIITSVGSSMEPNAEIIIATGPDVILANPYQNAGHGVMQTLGIPIVEMADYMEPTPLGRAEWIKLLGALYGNSRGADSIFDATALNYSRWMKRVPPSRPTVLTEMPFNGVWFVPGGNSYMARIIADAGGDYLWKENTDAGSLQLDFPTVFDKAHDAQFWFIKTDKSPFTYADLKELYPLNERFEAYKNKNVYYLDTSRSTFFEEISIHPDRLLRDFVIIMHPDSADGQSPAYYHPVE